ncbi:OmpA family protein [Hymenobacter sp. BRD128]|uniref:OmpA family protein n=1 Tax=Hymenobacter sp. BRD128 TaxID=2675878 RepID=UPI0015645B27|nr:OmpA family protein [Hymenobacter sp. BRD128]QKG55583.1 OmpA family protein [Hymenobacter sp. BRD128]
MLPGALLLAAGLSATTAQAQTPDRKTAIGVNLSYLQYQGNLGGDFGVMHFPLQVGVGAHITRYISPTFDLSLLGNYESYRFVADAAPRNEFTASIGMFDLGLKLKFNNGKFIKEDAFIQPYLMAGPGFFAANSRGNYGTFNPNLTSTPGSFSNQVRSFEIFGLAGLRFRLSPAIGLDVTVSQHYAFPGDNNPGNEIDNSVTGTYHDRFLVYGVGLTAALGKAKDTDGDGVPDRKDKCPNTPAGVKVDVNGCPLDTDGDGVPDYQDKCPEVKGLPALQGCPDSDGDGVADADDKCPNTPAGVRVDASGCPLDADGDGVPDYLDKCPGTPSGVKVDATGCPLDRDGDGVPDYQDRCPDRAGPASNKGCPEIPAEQKKILNEATKYINFDFNKATLKPSSYPRLNQMVQILNDYPDYSLSIAGHTDSKGDEAYNLRLSYERAASARKYMLEHGIPAERIESRGYGKTKPIADNKTAAGQALNRRVDFDPYLTGETNAAEAKYGPAPSIAELKAEGKKLPGKKTTGTGAPHSRKAPAKKAPAKRK